MRKTDPPTLAITNVHATAGPGWISAHQGTSRVFEARTGPAKRVQFEITAGYLALSKYCSRQAHLWPSRVIQSDLTPFCKTCHWCYPTYKEILGARCIRLKPLSHWYLVVSLHVLASPVDIAGCKLQMQLLKQGLHLDATPSAWSCPVGIFAHR